MANHLRPDVRAHERARASSCPLDTSVQANFRNPGLATSGCACGGCVCPVISTAAGPPAADRNPDVASPAASASGGDLVAAGLRELAGVLEDRDRLMGRAARVLIRLQQADGLHDRLGGMTLQVWLEHTCRIPGADAGALLGAIDVLQRMPSLLTGLCDRWLSWLQVAAICRAARAVPVARLVELDGLVAAAMIDMAGFEPNALVDDVWAWVDTARPTRLERVERARDRGEFVSMAPRLFGGGSLFADLGTVSFATVAEALDAALPAPSTAPRELDALDDDELDELFDSLDDQRRAHTRDHGASMAQRLVGLCERALAMPRSSGQHDNPDSTHVNPDGEAGTSARSARSARPLLLATIDAAALLDDARTPGWLLHTLAGGRMKVSTGLLQRLVDERGADLRTIVLDDCGQAIGVGRRTQVPPGWLRQAIWARDLVVTDPNGSCPVRRADLDHIDEWPAGPTDVDNLQPVGRTWHNYKTSRRWTVTRDDDGTTTWRHRRHGWTIRMAPPRRDLTHPPPDPGRRRWQPRAGHGQREGSESRAGPTSAHDDSLQPQLAGVG